MEYFCCTDTRRNAVRLHPTINGIDFLEVLDDLSDPYNERQTSLFVHFIKPLNSGDLNSTNFRITGGERIRDIEVVDVTTGPEASFPLSPPEGEEKVMVVKVSEAGDFSTYTLHLQRDMRDDAVPDGFDPVLAKVDFSFKVLCPSDFDCKPVCSCLKEAVPPPEINYLAKDYASFRKLMLDRMSLLLPEWKERNPADMGITMVEMMAYVADYLSYRQDAITSEAYLATSRKRVSVRRHARLVDYFMHDGCNARTWLHIKVGATADGVLMNRGEGAGKTRIFTRMKGLPIAFSLDSPEYEKAVNGGAKVFEMMHDIKLYALHNEMKFYTWGGNSCCLPKGATKATLKGSFLNLEKGDVLIFSEVLGPETGLPQDADPAHQHAVRLIEVTISYDLLFDEVQASPPVGSPPNSASMAVTEIKWDQSDALPFPLCVSGLNGIEDISIAVGNNVLVDHGFTIQDEKKSYLEPHEVPSSNLSIVHDENFACNSCERIPAQPIPPRFRPKLLNRPLTYASPFDINEKQESASSSLKTSVRTAMPAITLQEIGEEGNLKGNPLWKPKKDLLNSVSNAKEFVVEPESDGTVFIRFGDNQQGARPTQETRFIATYRIGNGAGGNIGARSLAHIATSNASVLANFQENAAVWNPVSAQGGMEAETIDEVKLYAPSAFRTQERAVTSSDYEEISKRCLPDVQRAAATFRWTGSWKTVFLSADRFEGLEIDRDFDKELRNCLERYRMAGYDLKVDAPLYVSLEITMEVCVNPKFFASDVKKALLELFSNRILAGGRRGLFHPDNFSFGQTVFLSPLYAAAQATQGVSSVRITQFQRQGKNSNEALASGNLLLGRREIARLDNDPNFRENGVFNLIMKGGRN